MTNLEYILLNASENDIANIFSCAFFNSLAKDRTDFAEKIATVITGFMVSRNDYYMAKETRLINVFLSLQYNENDWKKWAMESES